MLGAVGCFLAVSSHVLGLQPRSSFVSGNVRYGAVRHALSLSNFVAHTRTEETRARIARASLQGRRTAVWTHCFAPAQWF